MVMMMVMTTMMRILTFDLDSQTELGAAGVLHCDGRLQPDIKQHSGPAGRSPPPRPHHFVRCLIEVLLLGSFILNDLEIYLAFVQMLLSS